MSTFKWLVRRELWEARTVWVAPAICAAIVAGSALIAAYGVGTISVEGIDSGDLAKLHDKMTPEHVDSIASMALGAIAMPFFIMVMFTQFFYAIDALYGERRERAILFWKSLPISDAETVLSKLLVAAVIMPLASAAAAFVTQLLVFAIVSAKPGSLELMQGYLWTPSLWGGEIALLAYLTVAGAIWYLPLLGWCLLVSAWAPRSPVMYATLPPLGAMLGEFIVFRTHFLWSACSDHLKLFGLLSHALGGPGVHPVITDEQLEVTRTLADAMRPGQFLASADVWLGAAVGVAFVAAAIWVRRTRDEAA